MITMTEPRKLVRLVANDQGHTVTVRGSSGSVAIETGTDTAVVAVSFTEPNLLRAIAGHLVTEADRLQQDQGGGYGYD